MDQMTELLPLSSLRYATKEEFLQFQQQMKQALSTTASELETLERLGFTPEDFN